MNSSDLKVLVYGLIIGMFVVSCAGPSNTTKYQPSSSNLVMNSTDDEEHELIILDNNFNRWFQVNARPVNFHSLSYYESQNRRYVAAWNSLATSSRSVNSPFQNTIDYDYTENYGLDLNYQLFWYFRYIEDLYGRQYGFPL